MSLRGAGEMGSKGGRLQGRERSVDLVPGEWAALKDLKWESLTFVVPFVLLLTDFPTPTPSLSLLR